MTCKVKFDSIVPNWEGFSDEECEETLNWMNSEENTLFVHEGSDEWVCYNYVATIRGYDLDDDDKLDEAIVEGWEDDNDFPLGNGNAVYNTYERVEE
jgi:hypothetical protein